MRQVANAVGFAVSLDKEMHALAVVKRFVESDIVAAQKFSVVNARSCYAPNPAEHFFIVPMLAVNDNFLLRLIPQDKLRPRHEVIAFQFVLAAEGNDLRVCLLQMIKRLLQSLRRVAVVGVEETEIRRGRKFHAEIARRRRISYVVVEPLDENIFIAAQKLMNCLMIFLLGVVQDDNPLNIFKAQRLILDRLKTLAEHFHIDVAKGRHDGNFVVHGSIPFQNRAVVVRVGRAFRVYDKDNRVVVEFKGAAQFVRIKRGISQSKARTARLARNDFMFS